MEQYRALSRPWKRILSLAFAVLWIVPGPSAVAGLPSRCFASGVQTVQRPIGISSGTLTFPYRFHVSRSGNSAGPLVIYIPGGPGQTSIEAPLAYPTEFTIVRTDPRGVGCNEDPSILPESFRSEELARDVLAIVRELKPTRYILHGISYGTIVATWAGALAATEGVPPPEAIVLEGVIGRAFEPNEYLRGYFSAWHDVRERLSPLIREQLNAREVPVGTDSRAWAAWLATMLNYGETPAGSFLVNELSLLDPARPLGREALELRVRKLSEPPSEAKLRMYRQITCREFTPDVRDVKYDFDWKDGELVDGGARLCTGLPFDRPYQASNLKLTAPVYYFSGDLDPATPPWQARAHAAGRGSPTIFVEVLRGGHPALSMSLGDCAEAVWRSIANGGAGLESSLRGCTLETKVTRKTPASPGLKSR